MNMGIIAALKNIVPLLLYGAWVFLLIFSLSGRVKYGILFLVVLMPLQNIVVKLQAFPLGKDLNDILIACILIGSVIAAGREKRYFMESNPFNSLLILSIFYTYFALWNGSFNLGAPLPMNPMDPRVQGWKNYVVFFLLFWVVFNNIRSLKDMRFLFWVMVAVMVVINYYTLDQIKYSAGLASREKFTGTFAYLGVNETAAFYATYTFVVIGIFFFIKKKGPRMILLWLCAVNIYVTFFLFSRGAYAAFFIGACFIALFKKRWLLIPLLIIALSWKTVLPTEVIERIEQTQNEYGVLDESTQKRIIMWQQSMDLFGRSPIFGSGYYIFPYLGFALGDTHNVYIKILAEQGIIGLIFMLSVLVMGLRNGLRLFRRARDGFLKGLGLGFAACVLAIFVGNFFGDRWSYLPLGAFFWVFLAMVERGNRIVDEEKKKDYEDVQASGRERTESSAGEIRNQKSRVKMWNVRRGEA